MHREGLTDREWQQLGPLLPRRISKRGRPRRPDRLLLDGMLWIARTGAPWRDLPARFGPWQTVYHRFADYRRRGVWEQVLQTLQGLADQRGKLDWSLCCIDGSVVRAHGHAAGARKRPARADDQPGAPPPPEAEALGRSRGGVTTKIHLVCEGQGKPLAITLTPGQRHESTQVEAVLDHVRVPRRGGGAPRTRPDRLAGDKGYSYPRVRRALRRRGIPHLIPQRSDQRAQRRAKGRHGGRPPFFDRVLYRRRNVVERCTGRLKQFRRIATRYEKRALNYLGFLHLVAILLWLA